MNTESSHAAPSRGLKKFKARLAKSFSKCPLTPNALFFIVYTAVSLKMGICIAAF